MRLISQWGAEVADRIRRELPEVEVLDVPVGEYAPNGTTADALFVNTGNRPGPASPVELCRRHGVRWVQVASAGIERIPSALYEDGRVVTNGRTAAAAGISEFVLASMLAVAKRFPHTWVADPPPARAVDPSRYLGYDDREYDVAPPPQWGWAPLGGLAGATLGIVGFGGIGQATAVKARAFDMRIVALRRRPEPSPIPHVDIVSDLADLLRVADHLVLAAPLTPETRHLLDRDSLRSVKRGVHIVNVGRGGLIDNDALREALDDGRVGFASLDVHDPSPLPEGHWLYTHPRVHVTPHISWATPSGSGIVTIFLENLRRYVAGQPLLNVVDPDRGY